MKLISNNLILNASLSATSVAAGYAVTFLQSDLRGLKWRSTTLAAQTITATWTAFQSINSVALAITNLSNSATVRVRLYTNAADSTPVYDSGSISNQGDYFSAFFDIYSVKKLTILLTDASNPDGFMQASCLVTGEFFEPNMGEGAVNITFTNDNVISKIGGNTQVEVRQTRKTLSSDFPYLDYAEQKIINDIKNYNASHTPVFALAGNEQIYGYLQGLDSKLFMYHAYNFNLTIMEI